VLGFTVKKSGFTFVNLYIFDAFLSKDEQAESRSLPGIEMVSMSINRLMKPAVKRKKIAEVEWNVIKDFCKGCNFCIEFCPVDALEESDKLNAKGVHPPRLKNEDACIGCGLCERICPELAIFLRKKEGENR
jgi:2-oxoglutarate ferredoxin oxidoreductase subunit delta